MKKLVFLFVAMFAISICSCNNAGKGEKSTTDTTVSNVDSTADSINHDSIQVDTLQAKSDVCVK